MAGARPSGFKKGGGFLNNVDGAWLDYEFTTTFPGTDGKRKSNSSFNPLYGVITVKPDGADDPVTTTLFVGSADDFEIEDDGKTLVPVEEGFALWGGSEWAKFIESACVAGFPESDLPEDSINFEAMLNRRYRFVQQKDDEKTAKRGKRKDKKTGKEYDQQQLVISAVYDPVASRGGKSTAAAGKTAGKTTGKVKEADLTDVADEAVVKILGKFGGSCPKSKLVSAQAQMLLKKEYGDQADALRRLIYDDDYLAAAADREVITFDVASKAQTVAVA